jgi:hypothetical protein
MKRNLTAYILMTIAALSLPSQMGAVEVVSHFFRNLNVKTVGAIFVGSIISHAIGTQILKALQQRSEKTTEKMEQTLLTNVPEINNTADTHAKKLALYDPLESLKATKDCLKILLQKQISSKKQQDTGIGLYLLYGQRHPKK